MHKSITHVKKFSEFGNTSKVSYERHWWTIKLGIRSFCVSDKNQRIKCQMLGTRFQNQRFVTGISVQKTAMTFAIQFKWMIHFNKIGTFQMQRKTNFLIHVLKYWEAFILYSTKWLIILSNVWYYWLKTAFQSVICQYLSMLYYTKIQLSYIKLPFWGFCFI